MKVASFNGCKVYNLSSGKTIPQWLSESKKRTLLKDEDYKKRLELIQDFEVPTAVQCIKMTKDHETIFVAGTYQPIIKCYTANDMAMKFQRGLTCEVVAMECLSENYNKFVLLQSNRVLNFHASYGTHYSIRIPTFGRDMTYSQDSCDLFVAASSNEIYRFNLEVGSFKESLILDSTSFKGSSGSNKVHMNPVHHLLVCGRDENICDFFDTRSRRKISSLKASNKTSDISACKFDTDGITFCVGTSIGEVLIYDIRSSKPIYTKEHQYGLPIVNLTYHNTGSIKHIISTDRKVIKIWERNTSSMGKVLTNIETTADVNDMLVVEDQRGQSGLIMAGGEQSRVMTYFVPQLGPAPRWCSFLEGLTEELEETSGNNVYEDYKFVTKQELEDLGASGLIGTPMLRGYMHGFFIDVKLFNKLRAVSKPFEYEEHRKKKITEKIEANRKSRISIDKRLPKVNKELAEKFMKKMKNSNLSSDIQKNDVNKGLVDDRFSSLFEREEFEQDIDADDYKLHNPSKGNNSKTYNKLRNNENGSEDGLDDIYQQVEENDDSNGDSIDFDEEQEHDDDSVDYDDLDQIDARKHESGFVGTKKRKSFGDSGQDEEGPIMKLTKRLLSKKLSTGSKPPGMYEVAEGISSKAVIFGHNEELKLARAIQKNAANIPLSERIKAQSTNNNKKIDSIILSKSTNARGYSREMTYMPGKDKSKNNSFTGKQDSSKSFGKSDEKQLLGDTKKRYMRSKGGNSQTSNKPKGRR
eukprot:gene5677-7836_t